VRFNCQHIEITLSSGAILRAPSGEIEIPDQAFKLLCGIEEQDFKKAKGARLQLPPLEGGEGSTPSSAMSGTPAISSPAKKTRKYKHRKGWKAGQRAPVKEKKHIGRPKKKLDEEKGVQRCPGCKKKIKQANRWASWENGKLWHKKCRQGQPEKTAKADKADSPMTIDERFEKYQETYGCKPTCGSCGDEIPKASLAVYLQKEFFHQVCMQQEKEA
jgi:hypothetical protein